LAELGDEASTAVVLVIDAALEKTALAAREGEPMAQQLEALKSALVDTTVAAAAKTRGGPKAVADITALVVVLRASTQAGTVSRGTPAETERLDMLDGLIAKLTRQAFAAGESAAKELGEPAIAADLRLSALYGSRRRKEEPALVEATAGVGEGKAT